MIRGHIYKIVNQDTNDIYIGSTIQKYWRKRYYRHKINPKQENYGSLFSTPNHICECIEYDAYKDIETLRMKERHYQDIFHNHNDYTCVNKRNAHLSREEKNCYHQVYNKKYFAVPENKESKKWYNWRYRMKKKLLRELNEKLSPMN